VMERAPLFDSIGFLRGSGFLLHYKLPDIAWRANNIPSWRSALNSVGYQAKFVMNQHPIQ
jgi:hypothetical protein